MYNEVYLHARITTSPGGLPRTTIIGGYIEVVEIENKDENSKSQQLCSKRHFNQDSVINKNMYIH